jgi:hypothetical protein
MAAKIQVLVFLAMTPPNDVVGHLLIHPENWDSMALENAGTMPCNYTVS